MVSSVGLEPRDKRGHVFTSERMIEEFQEKVASGQKAKLQSIVIRNYADAMQHKTASGPDDYIRQADERLPHVDYEQISQCCKLIYTCSPAHKKAWEKKEDRAAFSGGDPPEPVVPALAVLSYEQDGKCRDEDLTFILHAPNDVGALVVEVRSQNELIATLRDGLKRFEKERNAAIKAREAAEKALNAARKAAQSLVKATEPPEEQQ